MGRIERERDQAELESGRPHSAAGGLVFAAGLPGSSADKPALTMSTRRVATWGLVMLSALFVIDSLPARFASASLVTAAEKQVDSARPAVTAALVAHLKDRKSSVSKAEQNRVTEAVLRSSRRYDLDPYLVTAVLLVESDARPWAESGKGAIGLMQVMPYMAEKLPLAGNLSTIESNVEAGCFILADNIRRLGEAKGISSYFWGRNIRGVAYLEKVEQARARVRKAGLSLQPSSSPASASTSASTGPAGSSQEAASEGEPGYSPRDLREEALAES